MKASVIPLMASAGYDRRRKDRERAVRGTLKAFATVRNRLHAQAELTERPELAGLAFLLSEVAIRWMRGGETLLADLDEARDLVSRRRMEEHERQLSTKPAGAQVIDLAAERRSRRPRT